MVSRLPHTHLHISTKSGKYKKLEIQKVVNTKSCTCNWIISLRRWGWSLRLCSIIQALTWSSYNKQSITHSILSRLDLFSFEISLFWIFCKRNLAQTRLCSDISERYPAPGNGRQIEMSEKVLTDTFQGFLVWMVEITSVTIHFKGN